MKYLMIVGGEAVLDNIDAPLGQAVRMLRLHEDVEMRVDGLDAVKLAARSLWDYFDTERKKPVLSAGSIMHDRDVARVTFQLAGYPDRGFAEPDEVDQALFLEVTGQ